LTRNAIAIKPNPKIGGTTDRKNQWGHSTLELIESHGNILCHSIADFVTAFAKYVTENAEAVCPHAVSQ
jgi:hypothetical protein